MAVTFQLQLAFAALAQGYRELGLRRRWAQRARCWSVGLPALQVRLNDPDPSRLILRLQSDFDHAAALAQPVAHREPTAALSQDPDLLLQSHFFVFNPSSTRRRMASERAGRSSCFAANLSTAVRNSS